MELHIHQVQLSRSCMDVDHNGSQFDHGLRDLCPSTDSSKTSTVMEETGGFGASRALPK